MAESKRSPVLAAVDAVHSALQGLSPGDREKVLAAVAALLEIPPSQGGKVSAGQQLQSVSQRLAQPASLQATSRPVSLLELVNEKQPTTNAQFITLFAYYREKYQNQPRFARGDLEGYFAQARQKPPSNFDRDFADTIKKGWIHEEGADSYITSRGIEAVEGGFPSERRQAEKPRTRKKKQGARKRRRAKR